MELIMLNSNFVKKSLCCFILPLTLIACGGGESGSSTKYDHSATPDALKPDLNPFKDIAGVYHLDSLYGYWRQVFLINEKGEISVYNTRSINFTFDFYDEFNKSERECMYASLNQFSPNYALHGQKLYKKDNQHFFVKINGKKYPLAFTQDHYINSDNGKGGESYNVGRHDMLSFKFRKQSLTFNDVYKNSCIDAYKNRYKPYVSPSVNATNISGFYNSSTKDDISYTYIADNGDISVYDYQNDKKAEKQGKKQDCYKKPTVGDNNYPLDGHKLAFKNDVLGDYFYIWQPYFAPSRFNNDQSRLMREFKEAQKDNIKIDRSLEIRLYDRNNGIDATYRKSIEPNKFTEKTSKPLVISDNLYNRNSKIIMGGDKVTHLVKTDLDKKMCVN